MPTHQPFDAQMIELRDMVLKIHNDMEHDRSKCEDQCCEYQDGKSFVISLYFLVLIHFFWQVYRKSLRNSKQRMLNNVNF